MEEYRTGGFRHTSADDPDEHGKIILDSFDKKSRKILPYLASRGNQGTTGSMIHTAAVLSNPTTAVQGDWSGGTDGGAIAIFFGGALLGVFALVYNERKQLVNAGVEMLKAPVHLAFKMLNFALEKMNFLFDFFSPLIDGVVDKLKRDFLNRGMDEVFHMVKVYRICAGPSNVFYFYFYLKRGRLDNFLIHSPTVQDQPCPPRRFAAKAAGRGV